MNRQQKLNRRKKRLNTHEKKQKQAKPERALRKLGVNEDWRPGEPLNAEDVAEMGDKITANLLKPNWLRDEKNHGKNPQNTESS